MSKKRIEILDLGRLVEELFSDDTIKMHPSTYALLEVQKKQHLYDVGYRIYDMRFVFPKDNNIYLIRKK